jgi:hypothetical protein
MKAWDKVLWLVLAIPFVASMEVFGQDEVQGPVGPWLFSVRAGGQFSDNRDGLKDNKESNLDLTIEPRADYRLRDGQRTLLDLALLPMLKWHSNPRTSSEGGAQNDTELFGTAAIELMHQLSPRVRLSLGDAITYNDDPEVDNGGATVRSSNNHIWNTAHAGVDADLGEAMVTGVKGSYSLKRYSETEVAENEDEDILDGQAYLKYKMGSGVNVLGLVGFSDFKNDSTTHDRGSQVYSVGAGLEKTFNPDLIGKVTGGYQHGEYNDENLDSIDTPNGSAELTLRAASATRFRLGASYGLYAPYVRPYSIQTLTAVTGAIDFDVLPQRLTLTLNGQFGHGEYDEEGVDMPGGSDDMILVGLSADYRMNRIWSLSGGYAYENWTSDVREEFSRNLVNFAVKAQL